MDRKKSPPEEFDIPLNRLDIAYVANCRDTRELERIVQILRSGVEGFYQELTERAEQRLRQLKPDSRLFRFEDPILDRQSLRANKGKPMHDWNKPKTKNSKFQQDASIASKGRHFDRNLPAVRKSGKINEISSRIPARYKSSRAARCTRSNFIPAYDDCLWQKYEKDEEMLADDRDYFDPAKINVLGENREDYQENSQDDFLPGMNAVEREELADQYKLRGNDFFKAKEYEDAHKEYSQAIKISAATAAPYYNNRAITNIRMKNYMQAMDDCDKCLELEPRNTKAMLRKAKATYLFGCRLESYDIYQDVLTKFDANNITALRAIQELRAQLGDLVPLVKDTEEDPNEPSSSEQKRVGTTKVTSRAAKSVAKPIKDFISANMIIQNRMVKKPLRQVQQRLVDPLAYMDPPLPSSFRPHIGHMPSDDVSVEEFGI